MRKTLKVDFIEPLEATALMLIQHTVESFINDYEAMVNERRNQSKQQEIFNHNLNEIFESVKDYIVAHYRLNSRTDSQYWRDNRENQNHSARLTALLKAWHKSDGNFEAALTQHNAELTYFAPSWYCLFAGKGHFHKEQIPPKAETKVAPTADVIKYCQQVSKHFIDHQQQLKKIYGEKWPVSN